jgi:hypothetical protein
MATTLASFLLSITGTLAARVLFSLGFGIFSYAALTTLVTSVVNIAKTNYLTVDSRVIQLLNLGGVGDSMAIITAALLTKAALLSIKKLRPL